MDLLERSGALRRKRRANVYLGEEEDDPQWRAGVVGGQQQQQQQGPPAAEQESASKAGRGGRNEDEEDLDDDLLYQYADVMEASQRPPQQHQEQGEDRLQQHEQHEQHEQEEQAVPQRDESGPQPKQPKMAASSSATAKTADAGRVHHSPSTRSQRQHDPNAQQLASQDLPQDVVASLRKATGEAAVLREQKERLNKDNTRLVQEKLALRQRCEQEMKRLRDEFEKEKAALSAQLKFLQADTQRTLLGQDKRRAQRKRRPEAAPSVPPAHAAEMADGFSTASRTKDAGASHPASDASVQTEIEATPLRPSRSHAPATGATPRPEPTTGTKAKRDARASRSGKDSSRDGGSRGGEQLWGRLESPVYTHPSSTTAIDVHDMPKSVYFMEGVVSSDVRAQEWLCSLSDPGEDGERIVLLATLAALVVRRPAFLAAICHSTTAHSNRPSLPASTTSPASSTSSLPPTFAQPPPRPRLTPQTAVVPVSPGAHRRVFDVVLQLLVHEAASPRVHRAAAQCLRVLASHCHPSQGAAFQDLYRPHVLDALEAQCTQDPAMMAEAVDLWSHIIGLAPIRQCGIPTWILAAAARPDTSDGAAVSFDAKVRLAASISDEETDAVTLKLAHALFRDVERLLMHSQRRPNTAVNCWLGIVRALKTKAVARWVACCSRVSDAAEALVVAADVLRISVALMRGLKTLSATTAVSEDWAQTVQATYASAHQAAGQRRHKPRRRKTTRSPAPTTAARTSASSASATAAAATAGDGGRG